MKINNDHIKVWYWDEGKVARWKSVESCPHQIVSVVVYAAHNACEFEFPAQADAAQRYINSLEYMYEAGANDLRQQFAGLMKLTPGPELTPRRLSV